VRSTPGGAGAPLQCWGANHHGHLGDGTTTDRAAPTASLAASATHIGLGQQHSCATAGASTSCWGWSHAGQAGTLLNDNPSPVSIALWPADALPDEIDGGDSFSCARIATRVGCWGDNASGQLGDPALGARQLSVSAPIGVIRDATALTAGGDAACVLSGGVVRCWGDNARGQVSGPDDIVTAPRYVLREGMPLRAIDVSMGPDHACAVTTDGDVACWGFNWSGALGNPSIPTGFGAGSIARDPVLVVGLP
jgi:alpha-tubulin suppressor-like RCC1 family protein